MARFEFHFQQIREWNKNKTEARQNIDFFGNSEAIYVQTRWLKRKTRESMKKFREIRSPLDIEH